MTEANYALRISENNWLIGDVPGWTWGQKEYRGMWTRGKAYVLAGEAIRRGHDIKIVKLTKPKPKWAVNTVTDGTVHGSNGRRVHCQNWNGSYLVTNQILAQRVCDLLNKSERKKVKS